MLDVQTVIPPHEQLSVSLLCATFIVNKHYRNMGPQHQAVSQHQGLSSLVLSYHWESSELADFAYIHSLGVIYLYNLVYFKVK